MTYSQARSQDWTIAAYFRPQGLSTKAARAALPASASTAR